MRRRSAPMAPPETKTRLFHDGRLFTKDGHSAPNRRCQGRRQLPSQKVENPGCRHAEKVRNTNTHEIECIESFIRIRANPMILGVTTHCRDHLGQEKGTRRTSESSRLESLENTAPHLAVGRAGWWQGEGGVRAGEGLRSLRISGSGPGSATLVESESRETSYAESGQHIDQATGQPGRHWGLCRGPGGSVFQALLGRGQQAGVMMSVERLDQMGGALGQVGRL